jgi:tetratricopeptide (TPR) repeat protein
MDKNKSLTIDEVFNLAVKNHQEGKTNIAQELYNQVLKIDPNHVDAHNNLGGIFKNLGETQKAKECFEKAIAINPNYAGAYHNLGVLLQNSGDVQKVKNCYEKAIEINPNYAKAHNNLGVIFKKLGETQKAKECYEKAIEINPNYANAHNNLAVICSYLGEIQKSKSCYEKAIEINPNYANAHNNLAVIFTNLKEYQKAKECYEKAIKINPNYAAAHSNLGGIFKLLGETQKAKECFEKAIEINPNYAIAYNNLGLVFQELGETQKAKSCYEKAIKINPNFTDAYYNLHSTSSNIDEALSILIKSNKIEKENTKVKITIAALLGYKGNFDQFNNLLTLSNANHPYIRSIKWVFSLPKLPEVFFNRSDFFDAVIALADNSRPFYEFGVWNGVSFQYLINTFKKGFGFDTFTGLPEEWHNEPKGSYTGNGAVPKIEGGEFIVGKFEDTLPNFFSKERPKASLINFDADLYSSTLCALNYSKKVIDEKTILIFDELIMNDKWEEDEYKALNEFCDKLVYSYEVIAVSFYTKQVAVKLKYK